jgi:predicted ATP-dependent endonuclease of OLD family
VNEFFFYENIVLVEGPTEQIAVQHVASKIGMDVHVINCLGKANIPLFARILNHFQVPYLVIHDADRPKVLRKQKYIDGGMWKINETIRSAAAEGKNNHVFSQFPHFEGEFLDEELGSGKVDRVLEVLTDTTCAEYARVFEVYSRVLKRDPELLTTSEHAFEAKRTNYVSTKGLAADPSWA